MTTEMLACKGCGRTKPGPTGDPTDLFPSEHCGHCPPWICEACGETCSFASPCGCWISVDGMPIADLKALLAADAEGRGGAEPSFEVRTERSPEE